MNRLKSPICETDDVSVTWRNV